jgi:hypothetical protein
MQEPASLSGIAPERVFDCSTGVDQSASADARRRGKIDYTILTDTSWTELFP